MSANTPLLSDTLDIQSIAFVDSGISQSSTLIGSLQIDRLFSGVSQSSSLIADTKVDRVVLLDNQTNAIEQITQTLKQHQNLESVHVFSHGSENTLQFANGFLSQSNLEQYEDDLGAWGNALSNDGDLLFYGCNVAASGDGFIHQISQMTQADVAASSDLTGHQSLGGNWQLEVAAGDIETTLLATAYEGTLAAVTVDTTATRYDYDFGTETSVLASSSLRSDNRPTTWQRITPNTMGDIRWSGGVRGADRGSRSGVNALNQDFVYSSQARTLSHKIANGVWDVVVNMGDSAGSHDNMRLSAEGVVLNGDIDSRTGQFSYGRGRVTVTDGVLDLKFEDSGGTDPNWVLNRLSLTQVREADTPAPPPPLPSPSDITVNTAATRYDYDFGTETSLLAPTSLRSGNQPTTWQRITPNTTGDIRWSGGVRSADRGSRSGINALNQDFVYSSQARTLSHKIANGVWDVVVNMGDSAGSHDNMRLSAEGRVLNGDIDSRARQFSYGRGRVTVTDGVLDLKFEDLGGADPNWVLNRLSLTQVRSADTPAPPPPPPSPSDVTVNTAAARYDYDFGTETSVLAPASLRSDNRPTTWQRITPNTTGDIRWSGGVRGADRGSRSGVNALNQDFVYSSQARTLSHKIANGVWDVVVNMGDSAGSHDNMRLSAEGVVLNGDIDSRTGQFSYGRGRITVIDGVLDLKFEDLGGADPNWVLNRLSLTKFSNEASDVVPNGSGFTQTQLASGFDTPTAFAYADDGRLFVSEKAGRIKVVENGAVVSTFIDISDEVHTPGDRGLIGFTLDPDFENNGWVYLQFSQKPQNGFGVGGQLIKVQASTANPNVADLSTRTVILDNHLSTGGSHSVGDVDFDNNGNLIFSWGDGGFSQELRIAAQNPDSRQGKFFRVDPKTGYGVPENPYYDPANPDSVRSKVWVMGVRNPWRWTVDRPTGDVYFGDVTDSGPEEANIIRANATEPAQLNFGWPYFEGSNSTRYGRPPAGFQSEGAYIELRHSGNYDAITGGAVYRGEAYPEVYKGRYFFANFGQNVFYTGDANGNFRQFGNRGDFKSPVDIQLTPNGTIQYLSMFEGALYQVNYGSSTNGSLVPNAAATASVTAGTGPLTVNFSSTGSSSPNGDILRYAWDFDSDGTVDSTDINPSHTYTTVGKQTATLTILDAVGSVDTTQVEVTVTDRRPTDGNLAFGKPTIQSSTASGALASRAVDGNTDDTFSNGSVSATTTQDRAFWEIDLGAVYDLNSVQIFVGNQPLSNFFVFTSRDEFVGGNFNALFTEPGVWFYQNKGEVVDEETININQAGRYLRIQLEDIGAVSLTEVKVFGSIIA